MRRIIIGTAIVALASGVFLTYLGASPEAPSPSVEDRARPLPALRVAGIQKSDRIAGGDRWLAPVEGESMLVVSLAGQMEGTGALVMGADSIRVVAELADSDESQRRPFSIQSQAVRFGSEPWAIPAEGTRLSLRRTFSDGEPVLIEAVAIIPGKHRVLWIESPYPVAASTALYSDTIDLRKEVRGEN